MGIFDFKNKQAELPYPDPRLVEAVRRIDAQTAEIARLEKEIEIRNGIIERNKYMWKLNEAETEKMLGQIEAAERVIEEYKKQEERLIKEIYRLRAELKKRTDQYNDLVDLAREKESSVNKNGARAASANRTPPHQDDRPLTTCA